MLTRPGVWTWLAVIAMAALSATLVFARPGVIKTIDGQTYDGDIDDKKEPDALIVTVRGITTRIERSRVASVQYPTGGAAVSFSDRLAKLGPRDVPGRMALAREAFNAHDYATARTAVDQALAIDPNNADAVAFAETIRGQMRLEQSKNKPSDHTATTTSPTTEATTQPGSEKVLKPQDINTIRQLELRADDPGVRVRFDHDVKKRFLSYYTSSLRPAEFNAMTPLAQAVLIIQKGTPEMRRDVAIFNDPPALFQFRRIVQPLVLQNCATSGCHGDRNPKKFSLVEPSESDAATYTNFYILGKYTKSFQSSDAAVFGRGDLRMIDRQHPEQSLLLQYGLPGAQAEYPHPDVPSFKPVFHGKADPHFQQIQNWIGKVLIPVEPDYGIDFSVPGMTATTAPTSKPASQPATTPTPPPPASHPAPKPPVPPPARPMRSPAVR